MTSSLRRRDTGADGPPGRRAGDLLVLADDLPTEALRLAARREAAVALIAAGRFAFAAEHFDALLAARPGDRAATRLRALCRARAKTARSARGDRTVPDSTHPDAATPRVVLFSGHMVDAPTRAVPRLPAVAVPVAAERIGDALDALGERSGDIAFSQAAAGGDLLVLEACRERGVRPQVLLPFAEDDFIVQSILPSTDGAAWRERWLALRDGLPWLPRSMDAELGACPEGIDVFERCNRWLLASALACAAGDEDGGVQLIALWNGAGGDGPGGTRHMIDEVQRRGGSVRWIDTRTL